MGNMKHRRGIDSLLALAHVGLCAVLIIAACGQLRSVDAFNVNIVSFIRNGVTTTTKIAPNDRTKVFIGGHVAASSGGYDKPAGRDPHPPGVNHHGAHHDHLGLPTSSRGFIVASRLFSSTDASLSDGDGLADEDDGNDERNADKFDFEQLNTSTDERVQKFKEAVLGNIQGGEKFRNLNALRSVIQYLKLYDALTGLNQFETDDEFAVRVIATCINDNLFNQLVGNDNDPDISIAERKLELVRRIYKVEKPGLDMKKLVKDVYFWKNIDGHKDAHKFVKEATIELNRIRDVVLEGNWNIATINTEFKNNRELSFLYDPESNDEVMDVVNCILRSTDKNAKETIDFRLSAFEGSMGSYLKYFEVVGDPLNPGPDKKSEESKTYFTGSTRFRHQGDRDLSPRKVFLSKTYEDDAGEVKKKCDVKLPMVFYSASGTGKTVEMAGSGYTREAVFTIVHNSGTADYDEGIGHNKEVDQDVCINRLKQITEVYVRDTNDCSKIIKPIIDDVYQKDKELQDAGTAEPVKKKIPEDINGVGNVDAHKDHTITFIFAIDEASACPAFIKRIIAEYADAGRTVAQVFCAHQEQAAQLKHHKIEVLFSFAGTGASNTAVGSQTKDYLHLEPSALPRVEEVYEVLRSTATEPDTLPTFKKLVTNYPIFGCIVKHNARMASIFLATLSRRSERLIFPEAQNDIICDMFDTFMRCNGMADLKTPEDQIKVAAQALAVHLFQHAAQTKDAKGNKNEADKRQFRYGIEFDPETDLVSVKDLVATYGIVTPNAWPKGDDAILKQPFNLDETMQLLCLWMLMQGDKQGHRDGLLQTSSFGFEVLATQIVSAVVTASMTLPVKRRPSIKYLLKTKLNFFATRNMTSLQTDAEELLDEFRNDTRFTPKKGTKDAEMVKMIRANDDFVNVLNFYSENKKELQHYAPKSYKHVKHAFDDYLHLSKKTTNWEDRKFKKMDEAKAIHVDYTGGTKFFGTYFQNSEMETNKFTAAEIKALDSSNESTQTTVTFVDKAYKKEGTTPLADWKRKTVLCMDTHLGDMLLGMRAAKSGNEGAPRPFFAPITTLAWGSSSLADGYVVFYGQRVVDGVVHGEPFRCCIAIQAKDSLGSGDLPFSSKIADNQWRVMHPILDCLLGKDRIYCVGSYNEKLRRGNEEPKLNVMGFPVDKSPILKEMMIDLSGRRGAKNAARQFRSMYARTPNERKRPRGEEDKKKKRSKR
mmetsp:Transcript_15930/g.44661  ORF Transcript_15930/g.44661 Transcript_15930/m.44661 type:complete len:1217 (+) Transcript_15930:153-3803(+)